MITPSNLAVNNNLGHSSVVSRFTDLAKQHNAVPYRPRKYTHEHKRHKEADRICDEKGYKPSARLLIHAMIKVMNDDCQLQHGQESLAKLAKQSLSTAKRNYKAFLADGFITSERRGTGWQDRETNLTTLVFLKTELPDVSVKMNHDINNPIIQDPDLKKTVLINQPEKFEKRPARLPDKPSSPNAVFSIFTNLGLSKNDSAGLFNVSKRLKLTVEHVLTASERFIAYKAKTAVPKPGGVLRRILEAIAGEIRTAQILQREKNWEVEKQKQNDEARKVMAALNLVAKPMTRAQARQQAIAKARETVKAKGITNMTVIEVLIQTYENQIWEASHVRH